MSTKSPFNQTYRVLAVFVLIFGVLLSSFNGGNVPSARAQEAATATLPPEATETVPPPTSPEQPSSPVQNPYRAPYTPLIHPPVSGSSIFGQGNAEVAVPVGEPGLSFRYVKTFGKTGIPYFADTTHLNRPIGLFIDGSNNLYVTEDYGQRVLKYNSAKSNLLALGKAGVCITDNYMFCTPKDTALNGSSNLWVADGNRVVEYDTGGNFIQQMPETDPWVSGNDDTHFNYVNGIAFDSIGRMYVSDTNNHRVQVYTFTAGVPVYSATIGVTGIAGDDNDHFSSPHRLAVDSSDRLYVTDRDNNRVQRCEFSGTWTCTVFDSGLGGPQGIAVDGSDNVFIADLYNGRIRKCPSAGACVDFAIGTYGFYDVAVDSSGNVFASATYEAIIVKYNSSGGLAGTFLGKKFVPYLTDQYHYYHPRVAIDGSNNIIIIEENGHRLTKLNASGVLQWSVGVPGVDAPDNKHFTYPHGVATDNGGKIYVADNCRVQIFSPTGSYLSTLGTGCGTGDYEFGWVTGVDVDQNGKIYVVDYPNHRVQIYTSNHLYAGRIGVTGDCSTANDHLCSPIAVDVDANGNIYVTDGGNLRVQKFNSSRVWQMTIGDGTWGESFNQLSWPEDVVVDAQGRIFVSDWANNRVQVFDASGAYLTTMAGSWGSNTSQLMGAPGIDVDSSGNVYVADWENHRIQKFARGVPGWKQVNINGFGDLVNSGIWSLSTFDGQIYAGTSNVNGAQIWRSADEYNWSQFTPIWTTNIDTVMDMESFGSNLYAGVSGDAGGEIWRTDGLTWSQVVYGGFGDTNNYGINALAVFSNEVYAATSNVNGTLQIYRSTSGDSGSWTPVVSDGFGSNGVAQDVTLDVYGGYLYIGLGRNGVAELWRTNNGTVWSPVFTDGLAINNSFVSAMADFNGTLYIGLRNFATGGEVWSSTDGINFNPVFTGGLGNPNNRRPYGLHVFYGRLYLVFTNTTTGAEIWRTANGTTWEQIIVGGWGDSNNAFADYFDKGATIFNNSFFLATLNSANGGEVWKYLRPVVTNINTITDTGDGALSEGEKVIVPVKKLTVTFNKDVKPPKVTDFVLTKGATIITINSVSYDSLTKMVTLNVNDGKKLPYGAYTLTVKKTISDTQNNKMAVNFVRQFSLVKPPGVPLLIAPINNALVYNLQPKLDWSNSTIPAGTTFDHYQIQLATNAAFTSPLDQNAAISEFTPASPLTLDTKYYWRVRTYNTLGQASAWSVVGTFREAMLPPDLISPANGAPAGTRKPAFDWSDVANNTGYIIQVSASQTFGTLLLNVSTSTGVSTYTPTTNLPAAATLYWRVRAKGPNGPSAWSTKFSFTTP